MNNDNVRPQGENQIMVKIYHTRENATHHIMHELYMNVESIFKKHIKKINFHKLGFGIIGNKHEYKIKKEHSKIGKLVIKLFKNNTERVKDRFNETKSHRFYSILYVTIYIDDNIDEEVISKEMNFYNPRVRNKILEGLITKYN